MPAARASAGNCSTAPGSCADGNAYTCPYTQLTVFEPNVDAKRFYEREGFREVPEGRRDDTEEGVPILLMRWRGAP